MTSKLSEGERKAVAKLIEAGQDLSEALRATATSGSARVLSCARGSRQAHRFDAGHANLLTLYRINQGPIATTLEEQARAVSAGGCFEARQEHVSVGNQKEEIDQTRADLLDLRTVVRSSTAKNLKDDIAVLQKYPALQTLHPKLLGELQRLQRFG